MATASVSSLGPPNIGPGNSAVTVGFTVSAQKSISAARLNSEPLSGNTLCHKNNVERKRAIHENRLASVKASLSLSTPRRMDFMDKRLSKNFHQRRHHEKVVYENLKLLRALEEIHSRSSAADPTGDDRSPAGGGAVMWSSNGCGGKQGPRGGLCTAAGAKRSKGLISGSATCAGDSTRKKLNSLFVRKRKVKAALVARENQKMIERMAKSKSLYSREKMRQHRARHQRVLRLRKTDYTAGHLLAAATAKRHWSGGDSRDEGFSYSFEEGRHRHHHRNLHTQENHERAKGGGGAKASASSPTRNLGTLQCSSATDRGASFSPTRGARRSRSVDKGGGSGGGDIRGRGTKSAPRLPSLYDVDDIYGGGGMLGSPSLEQCREATDMWSGSHGGGGDGGGGRSGSGSRASSSRNSAPGSGNNDDGLRPRSSTDGGTGSRGGSRHHRKSSRQRCGKDAVRSGGGSSTGGIRGTDSSVDSLSHRLGSFAGSVGEGYGGSRGGGRFRGQRGKRGPGSRGEKSLGSSVGADQLGEGDDLDKIFNPLAFLDEAKGVRVLIQATKPLEVLHHAGETWICFIRIMVKDPFDDQLDIRVIHDREEVCRRVLSLKEANAICQHAQATSGGAAIRHQFSVFTPGPCRSPSPLPNSRGVAASSPPASGETAPLEEPSKTADDFAAGVATAAAANGAAGGEEGAPGGVEADPRSGLVSGGLGIHSKDDGSLNDFLTTLFKRADTEQKGFLTPEQLTSIMQHAELGLTGPELHLVIAEADDNADGTIDYFEFIPLAYNLVNAFRARRRACEEMDEANFELDRQAIHALYDAEFDRLVRQLKSLCKSHDPDGTGVLSRAEFKQCVSSDRCGGLTNIESKLLLNLLPKDPHGNVIYRKLGAGLEQVRFTTLRNTVAEASASDTQKYLMALCREEDAKSDHLGNKGLIKTNGDAIAIGGKHYSGVLRARQLTKLLLNAPLLSLSRLHVTALLSQAHIVDGMVNYVELVPTISKTIEGMFHPRSLKMRHEIFKNRGTAGGTGGGGAGGGGGGGTGEGSSQQQGPGVATVLGKSRDDIQRIFVDVLREDKQGAGVEGLKDPATFARCLASLGLDLEPDTISALWTAADLDSRSGTTFVDIVDFCFNCVLFMEREKEVKTLQRTRNTASRASQNGLSGRATPGAAAVARAEAVAAAALAGRETPAGKSDPLLSLARTLVRHAKVTAPSEGKVGLEFQLHEQGCDSKEGCRTNPGRDALPLKAGQSAGRKHGDPDGGGLGHSVGTAQVGSSLSADTDEEGSNSTGGEGGARGLEGDGRAGGGGGTLEAASIAGLRLRSEAPEATVLLRARRKVPVVGSSGQPIMVLSAESPVASTAAAAAAAAASGTATRTSDDAAQAPGTPSGQRDDGKASRQRDSTSSLETAEAARGETRDMFVRVYWDGAARDRAFVEAYPAKAGCGESGAEGRQSLLLSLSIRVPTLAIVDSHAASNFAERVVTQIAVQVDDEKLGKREKKTGDQQQRQHRGGKLRLAGVDAKSVVVGT